jgi:hypothetical protein
MKVFRPSLILVVALSPLVGLLFTGCDSSKEVPLAKVTTPPPLPLQDKSKVKVPKGGSPNVLPQN